MHHEGRQINSPASTERRLVAGTAPQTEKGAGSKRMNQQVALFASSSDSAISAWYTSATPPPPRHPAYSRRVPAVG